MYVCETDFCIKSKWVSIKCTKHNNQNNENDWQSFNNGKHF